MVAKKATEKDKMEEEGWREEAVKSVQEAWSDFRASLRSFLPEEFWEHRRAARREMLLAMRSLIDAAIERIEEEEAPERKRAEKIEVT